jgi:uncharacterized RDD family membrane protein YckC
VPAGGYGYPGQLVPAYLPSPPPVAPGGAPLAEPWERLLGYLIDSLVLLIPTIVAELIGALPIIVVLATAAGHPSPGAVVAAAIGSFLLVFVLIFAVSYGYEVIIMQKTGQTVGRRVMKIRIVSAAGGGPIDRPTATRRWLVKQVAPVFGWFGFSYADVLWQLWDQPYRQCLHDKCAETVVVKVAVAGTP